MEGYQLHAMPALVPVRPHAPLHSTCVRKRWHVLVSSCKGNLDILQLETRVLPGHCHPDRLNLVIKVVFIKHWRVLANASFSYKLVL